MVGTDRSATGSPDRRVPTAIIAGRAMDPTPSWGIHPMDPTTEIVDGGPMDTTFPAPLGPPIAGIPPAPPAGDHAPATTEARTWSPGIGRTIQAIVVAFAMQLAAVFTAYVAVGIALLAAFSTWATEEETPWWGALSIPVAFVAIGIFVASGYVAARITRSRWGWLAIGLVPVAAAATTGVFGLI